MLNGTHMQKVGRLFVVSIFVVLLVLPF